MNAVCYIPANSYTHPVRVTLREIDLLFFASVVSQILYLVPFIITN